MLNSSTKAHYPMIFVFRKKEISCGRIILTRYTMQRTTYLFSRVILILIIIISSVAVFSQQQTDLNYTVSAPRASSHYFHVELFCSHWNSDTVEFKMPKWTPGYYQIMDF